jgi:hypothetical protein
VTTAFIELDEMTISNAASARETAAASDALAEPLDELRQLVEDLQRSVGVDAGRGRAKSGTGDDRTAAS